MVGWWVFDVCLGGVTDLIVSVFRLVVFGLDAVCFDLIDIALLLFC